MSYKTMLRSLGYNKNDYYFADGDMMYSQWYNYYFNYFMRLITNRFKWEGLPDTIDTIFLEKNLSINGYIGMYHDENFGLIVANGVRNGYDLYNNPLYFQPTFTNIQYHSKSRKVFTWGDNLNSYNQGDVIIIDNNNLKESSFSWLGLFCEKLANLEVAKEINRVHLMIPKIFLVNDDTELMMKQFIAEISAGKVPFLKVKEKKSSDYSDQNVTDKIKSLDFSPDYLLDRLTTEITNIKNQVLTISGINHLPVYKKERLVTSEVDSNDVEVVFNLKIELEMREKACELINVVFKDLLNGETVTVKPNVNEDVEDIQETDNTDEFDEDFEIEEGE